MRVSGVSPGQKCRRHGNLGLLHSAIPPLQAAPPAAKQQHQLVTATAFTQAKFPHLCLHDVNMQHKCHHMHAAVGDLYTTPHLLNAAHASSICKHTASGATWHDALPWSNAWTQIASDLLPEAMMLIEQVCDGTCMDMARAARRSSSMSMSPMTSCVSVPGAGAEAGAAAASAASASVASPGVPSASGWSTFSHAMAHFCRPCRLPNSGRAALHCNAQLSRSDTEAQHRDGITDTTRQKFDQQRLHAHRRSRAQQYDICVSS